MRRTMLVMAAVCLALVATTATAQEQLSNADRDFLLQAASGGLAEVKVSQFAQERATSPEVKKFAQHMIQDHTQANKELMTLAEKKGVRLPTAIDPKHQALIDQLTKLSGVDFDRQFMSHQVKDHQDSIALFEAATREVQDPEVKAFAAKTLPTLREHLKMAQQLTGQNRPGTNR